MSEKGAEEECGDAPEKRGSAKHHGGGLDVKAVVHKCQKKIITSMANRKNVRPFLSDNANAVLDALYHLLRDVLGSKKVAEKCVKNLIKVAIKISFLVRDSSDKLTEEDKRVAVDLRMRLKRITLTLISFSRVEFSYDQRYLISHLEEARSLTTRLMQPHTTAKTIGRVNNIFDTLTNGSFLDALFRSTKNTVDRSGEPLAPASNAHVSDKENAPSGTDSPPDNPHRERLNELVTHMEALLDEGFA